MKKKIKDLTIGEIIDACRKSKEYCHNCPLFAIGEGSLPCWVIYDRTDINVLEKEVEA